VRASSTHALNRHSAFFARYLAERERRLKGAQPRQALLEIEAEHDNVRAAWSHMTARRQLENIALCQEALHLFHTHRASFGEGESAFRALADALRPATGEGTAEQVRLYARGLSFCAMFLRQQGRYAQAETLLEEALSLLDEQRHPTERAFALVAAGSTRTKTGALAEGKRLVEEGIGLYRSANDTWGLANALETLGRIFGTAGDFAKSSDAFRESTIVQRGAGMLQSGLMGLGVASVQQGNYAQGCRMMLDALEMFEQAGDTWNKMRCEMNLANAQRNLGNYASAEAYAKNCLAFWREVGNWDHEAWCYFQLGNILKEQELYEDAAEMYGAAHARSVETGDAGKIALARMEFGGLALIRRDYEEAKRQLLESLSGFESAGQAWGAALALDCLGYVACQERDWQTAVTRFQRALHISMNLRLYPFATNVLAGIALLYAKTGRSEQAVELLALVQAHGATERHTIKRRVEPLLAELESALPADAFSAAMERGKARELGGVGETLAAALVA
jgi:tetratricopeptide (TPR) repeat protein